MDNSIRIGIVAHLARAERAKGLAKMVGAEYISIDDGSLGCTGNHAQVLDALANKAARYSVVLEDDAVPVPDFRAHIQAAIASAPMAFEDDGITPAAAPIVSAYLGTGYPRYWQKGIRRATLAADQAGAPWIVGEHLLHAVGYAIRTDLIPDLLTHRAQLPIDDLITGWARTNHHPVAYTWPSLCNHHDGPSVITGRTQRHHPRHAHRTGTRTNWAGPTVTLEY